MSSEKIDKTAAPPAVTTTQPRPNNDVALQDTADVAALEGQKEIEQYVANLRELLNQEKFEEIDRLAATARSTKARFTGGEWKLFTMYAEISRVPCGDKAGDADWTASLERLKRWASQRPESITPRVALAETYLHYAWKARGRGYADKVTEDGWKLFAERAQLAREILEEASALKEKCPQWYRAMQTVALAQGWDKAEAEALLDRAMSFEPEYYYYYVAHAYYLLPKWNGEEGESETFADAVSTKLGGEQGEITYYKIARDVSWEDGDRTVAQKLSWPRIRQGYAVSESQYGASIYELNKLAYMSIKFKDSGTANKFFILIGEHWNKETWHTKKYFDDCKSWATSTARLNELLSAVTANLHTPEGQQYDLTLAKEFHQNFDAAMNDCVRVAGKDLRDFSFYIQVAKDGKVSSVVPVPATAVNGCLAPKLQAGTFSNPPGPSYWVLLNLYIKR